jgi:hypothetical protein
MRLSKLRKLNPFAIGKRAMVFVPLLAIETWRNWGVFCCNTRHNIYYIWNMCNIRDVIFRVVECLKLVTFVDVWYVHCATPVPLFVDARYCLILENIYHTKTTDLEHYNNRYSSCLPQLFVTLVTIFVMLM